MRITYDNKTIDFFNFETLPSQIIMGCSGGLDSAAILYLICKHFPEIEIIPYTAVDDNYPKHTEATINVDNWFRLNFPDNKIKNLEIFNINQKDRNIVSDKTINHYKNTIESLQTLSSNSVSKTIQLYQVFGEMYGMYPDVIQCLGMTANPPNPVLKKYGFLHTIESRRTITTKDGNETLTKTDFHTEYKPFHNVDKKFVADIYEKNELMESLFPLTWSCNGSYKDTNAFTEPCKKCFWCHEKKWAFGIW